MIASTPPTVRAVCVAEVIDIMRYSCEVTCARVVPADQSDLRAATGREAAVKMSSRGAGEPQAGQDALHQAPARERRLDQISPDERGEEEPQRVYPVAQRERGQYERSGDQPDGVVHRHVSLLHGVTAGRSRPATST